MNGWTITKYTVYYYLDHKLVDKKKISVPSFTNVDDEAKEHTKVKYDNILSVKGDIETRLNLTSACLIKI